MITINHKVHEVMVYLLDRCRIVARGKIILILETHTRSNQILSFSTFAA